MKLTKKLYSTISFRNGITNNSNNNNKNLNNTSSINNNINIFNDSKISSFNDSSINNSFNFRLNNDISKMNSELNNSNSGSRSINKRKNYSNLEALLKDKYYIDVEKRLNHKLDAKLFPSDLSTKDKIIHMKKVSIFWNSVFKYCVPIINGQKYKLQHDLTEKNKIKYYNLNQSNSNYYDIFVKNNNKSKYTI